MPEIAELGDLEKMTLELWSAVSDLATIVERLTEADDADMAPVRASLTAVNDRIHKIRLARINSAQERATMPTDLPAAARRVAEATAGHYDPDPEDLRALLPVLDALAAGPDGDREERWTAAVRAACEHGSATTISCRRIAGALAALADAERAAAGPDDDAAYAFVRGIYEATGGATPALRDAYEAYRAWKAGGEERAAVAAEGWRAYEDAKVELEDAVWDFVRGGPPARMYRARTALDAAVRRLAGMPDGGA